MFICVFSVETPRRGRGIRRRATNMQNNNLFAGKYRTSSSRLRGFDYAQNGAYFVTICTKDKRHFFGTIRNGEMRLSSMGGMVASEWENTATIRKNVELGPWVVMPNHFHAIVIITGSVETPRRGVSTVMRSPHHRPEWKSGSLGAIINQFKSRCTKCIRMSGFSDFSWQSRFHDRIIRNEEELQRIEGYILCNVQAWESDCHYSVS